ncbi:MAG: DUF484 family protein [Gammaproteobacteria bacterium]
MTDRDPADLMPNAAAVARYLAAHPEFFNQHLELLRTLEIPHATGQAVSLWERQIAALRDEIDRMRTRYDELIDAAKHNEALIRRIQKLALELMDTAGPHAAFHLLAQRLAEEFRADRVTGLVFAGAAFVDSDEARQFVGADSPRREPFKGALARREPICGRLTQAQTQALFGVEAFDGSHVVLPLTGKQWDGLLVVSSQDPTRFESNMGTEFLGFLRDVLTLVLEPWVAKPRRHG